jgi:arylsulfatase A-like enzyme
MAGNLSRVETLVVLALAIVAATASTARGEGACEQINDACRDAGFVRGRAASGEGLRLDCFEPLVQGRTASTSSRALPRVDPALIAACRAEKASASGGTDSPADSAQPPPATGEPPAPYRARAADGATRRPNIVFVLTDDLSWNLVPYMPHVVAMQKAGATFANYFVTDSLCCPSRASIFTGRYPHNTGVFRNTGEDGGYLVFRSRGNDRATFATALSAAGYRTAMLGKYLNGYLPAKHPPAPGWTSWAVAGHAYAEFNYNLNENGRVVHYGSAPSDYLTDVLSGIATRFIKQAGGALFMIEIATFAPHAPYTPAPRDAAAFAALRAPRTPAFGADPGNDAPRWLRSQPVLSREDVAMIDADFRKRAQSVLAVDAMIGELQAAVASIGQSDNTYFIFSSDNGYHMGEHRLRPGKMTAFDTDIHVPLIITGPGIAAGTEIREITENVDLCPTFAELGAAAPPPAVDGRSLVPLLRGERVADWRTFALIEHRRPDDNDTSDPDVAGLLSGNPTTYEAIRGANSVYVEYATGEREYHDLVDDPHELGNGFATLPDERKGALRDAVEALRRCSGRAACAAAQALGPR